MSQEEDVWKLPEYEEDRWKEPEVEEDPWKEAEDDPWKPPEVDGWKPFEYKEDERRLVELLLVELVGKQEDLLENLERGEQVEKGSVIPKGMKKTTRGTRAGQEVIEQGKDYFVQLPKEMLLTIFVKLKDIQDLYSVYKTCKKFEKVIRKELGPKKTFLLVFPREIMPNVVKYLSKKDLVKCRAVCKSWKASVDDIITNALNPGRSSYPLPRQWKSGYCVDLSYEHKMNQFIEDIDNNKLQNPFFWRKLILDLKYGLETKYWEKASQVLDRFGVDIWSFSISVTGDTEKWRDERGQLLLQGEETQKERTVEFFKMVRECLVRLPNLRKLELGYAKEDEDFELVFNAGMYGQLEDFLITLASEHLPKLAHLTELELLKSSLPPPLFFHLIPFGYWEHIRKLQMTDAEALAIFTAAGVKLPVWFYNLKSLTLLISSNWHWQDLPSKLKQLRCPLEEFEVTTGIPELNMVCFLDLANYFGRTLRRIRYERVGKDINTILEPLTSSYLKACLELTCPCLKIVELVNPVESFNFLASTPAVEYLSIKFDFIDPFSRYFARMQDEIMEIYGFTERMFTSTIWAKLPRLQEFKCKGPEGKERKYKRSVYNNFVGPLKKSNSQI